MFVPSLLSNYQPPGLTGLYTIFSLMDAKLAVIHNLEERTISARFPVKNSISCLDTGIIP